MTFLARFPFARFSSVLDYYRLQDIANIFRFVGRDLYMVNDLFALDDLDGIFDLFKEAANGNLEKVIRVVFKAIDFDAPIHNRFVVLHAVNSGRNFFGW
jgi:hypothetical protein